MNVDRIFWPVMILTVIAFGLLLLFGKSREELIEERRQKEAEMERFIAEDRKKHPENYEYYSKYNHSLRDIHKRGPTKASQRPPRYGLMESNGLTKEKMRMYEMQRRRYQ